MRVVVLTGGIGSGKSLAGKFLEDTFGWNIYNADQKVKELYQNHPSLLVEIEAALDARLRDEEGKFQPSFLAEKIFSDREALERVEAIVFPVLTDDLELWKNDRVGSDVILLESATILGKPQLHHLADYWLVIDAPLGVRLERASQRDEVPIELVRMRADNQMSLDEVCDELREDGRFQVIVNDGSVDELYGKLRDFADKIQCNKNVVENNFFVK